MLWSCLIFRDGDGDLNFKEFLLATHETVSSWFCINVDRRRLASLFQATGSAEQKIRWQFRLYDKEAYWTQMNPQALLFCFLPLTQPHVIVKCSENVPSGWFRQCDAIRNGGDISHDFPE